MSDAVGPPNGGPGATGSPKWEPPAIVWWLMAYLGVVGAVCVAMCLYVRSPEFLPGWSPVLEVKVRHAVYALCWGALGASLNASLAVAKHCGARDFDESWNWWYLAKPPMGAMIGVAVYVLANGLGGLLGMEAADNAFGVVAVAFVAGFATHRVVQKIDAVSKTLFEVAPTAARLAIEEPTEGQVVEDDEVNVTARATAPISDVYAVCLEDRPRCIALSKRAEDLYGGQLTLTGEAGTRTIRITAVGGGAGLTSQVQIKYQPLPEPGDGEE